MAPSPRPAAVPTSTLGRRHASLALGVVAALVLSVLGVVAVGAPGRRPAPFAGQAPAASSLRTLFAKRDPAHVRVRTSSVAVEVGTRFRARRDGWVHGVRFWTPDGSAERRVVSLVAPSGRRLRAATVDGVPGRGWHQVDFARPVHIGRDVTYLVSQTAADGVYAAAAGYARPPRSRVLEFAGARSSLVRATDSAAVADGRHGWRSGAVFVDVLFAPDPPEQATPSPSSSPSSTSTPTATAAPSGVPSPAATPTGTTVPPSTMTPPVTTSPAPTTACKAVPSSCGYPDSTNTGPAAGTVFTRVPADRTSGAGWAWNATYQSVFVSGAGAVLDSLDIAGAVVIDAPNVIVRNSRIASCGGQDDSDVVAIRYRASDSSYRGSHAQVLHNQINGTPAGCTHRARSGVRDVYGEAPQVVVNGNDIFGSGNGITIEYQGVISDNWVHDLGHLAGDHHSGLSTHGGALQVDYVHNTVLLAGASYPGGGGLSGAITVYADFGHAQNTTIQDNFVSGGGYVLYGGNSGDAYTTPSTGIRIRGNRFVCGEWLYGPVTAFIRTSPGNEWTGNYCDGTGATVSP